MPVLAATAVSVISRRSRSRRRRGPTSASTSGTAEGSPMGPTLQAVPGNGNEPLPRRSPARTLKRMEPQPHDVAIVGGGAAGLSAALVLGRARRRVVVVDAGEPRTAPAGHLHGFLSRDGMPPAELLATARAEVRRYGVEIVPDRVIDATTGFRLRLAGGRVVEARQVLLAIGAADQLPD